jgi:hypothetical protein
MTPPELEPPVMSEPKPPIAPGCVFIGGPRRLQKSEYWLEAITTLRERFKKHTVAVAGEARVKWLPVRILKAYVLVVPEDSIIGYTSYDETRRALAAVPTWAYVNGELHNVFALRLHDTSSQRDYARITIEPGAEACVVELGPPPPRKPSPRKPSTGPIGPKPVWAASVKERKVAGRECEPVNP